MTTEGDLLCEWSDNLHPKNAFMEEIRQQRHWESEAQHRCRNEWIDKWVREHPDTPESLRRLALLSSCFYNIHYLGNEYDAEIMREIMPPKDEVVSEAC
ncbi:MAG: hypothetical protein KVP17_002386 [Porospora cf. gigantea B]|uniref:uncharacterized protein n=1 Tax=Porospora cf. gigantea B TaxID=2853592 RepID=UPI003571A948|nr:MAG: hypothetical protein KVP17_002386 [Porospora cf. gigantea B]